MPMDRFLIAPFDTGLQLNLKPWLIMDDAWEILRNEYVFRGRVKKRFGSQLIGEDQLHSRLRILLGMTDGAGNFAGNVPGSVYKIGQLFSVDTQLFTVYQNGNPAVMLHTSFAANGTYSTTTGAVTITGSVPNEEVFFYPAEPVMGFTQYAINQPNLEPSYAFDTQFAYVFTNQWTRSAIGQTPTWHGIDTDFYWSTNWRGQDPSQKVLFTTNFHAEIGTARITDDPIWSFDGTTWVPLSYSPDPVVNPTNLQPYTVTDTDPANSRIVTNYVQSCRLIVLFKNSLFLLNTIENNANGYIAYDPLNPLTTGVTPANYLTSTNKQYKNRARYCAINASPFDRAAWLSGTQQFDPDGTGNLDAFGGSFIDAPIDDEIISAAFIKDRLIITFYESTWEIVFTGNTIEPFRWQKINDELGSQSTFGTIEFDREALSFGTTGINACNSQNVVRIDDKIPDTVFGVEQPGFAPSRIAGIRDFFAELAYWSAPSTDRIDGQTFPNAILLYNYQNKSWAQFDDCITAFGNWYQTQIYIADPLPFQYERIIAGNPEGFVFVLDTNRPFNSQSMQITNIQTILGNTVITVVDNTLGFTSPFGFFDCVFIEGVQGVAGLNGQNFIAEPIANSNDVNLFILDVNGALIPAPIIGAYTGGGTIGRVSFIQTASKQWNPYGSVGRNFHLAKIDFGVTKTDSGAVTAEYFASASEGAQPMLQNAINNNMVLGTGVLDTSPYASVPFETFQTLLWHPVYFQTTGENIQIMLYFTLAQWLDVDITQSQFELQGVVLFTQPTSQRLQ